jgi:hypothetical protein
MTMPGTPRPGGEGLEGFVELVDAELRDMADLFGRLEDVGE